MAFISRGGYRLRKVEENLTNHSISAKQAIATTLSLLQTNAYDNLVSVASSIYIPIAFSVTATAEATSGLLLAVLNDSGTYKADSRAKLGSSPFKNTKIGDDDILILGNFETVRCLISDESYDFSLESMAKGSEFLELRFSVSGLLDVFDGKTLHGLMYKTYPTKANIAEEPLQIDSFETFPEYTKVTL